MPPEAWFWCSLLHGITVFTFPDLPNQCQTWWPKASEIESYGCLWEHKDEKREVQKTSKTCHHKSINKCHKYAPKGGSPTSILFCFLRSPSQDGLQGVPGQAPRHKNMPKWWPRAGFLLFCDNNFILFGCTFEMFEYTVKNVLIILFVKVMTLVVQKVNNYL